MTTYLLMNAIVSVAVLAPLVLMNRTSLNKYISITLVIVLVMTVFFDSLIILAGIVDYDYKKTLGIILWHAPIEDLFYTVVAVLGVTLLWEKYENKR